MPKQFFLWRKFHDPLCTLRYAHAYRFVDLAHKQRHSCFIITLRWKPVRNEVLLRPQGPTHFCKSEFLNFSAFSSIRSCSALFFAAERSTECFTSATAEGLFSGSGLIITWEKKQENKASLLKASKTINYTHQRATNTGILTFSKSSNSWESTCGSLGSFPCRISCHWSPLVGSGSAPAAQTTVRARAKISAFGKWV